MSAARRRDPQMVRPGSPGRHEGSRSPAARPLRQEPARTSRLPETQVQIAQKGFLDEVRWRLEIGVILLTGIQVLPELRTERTAIPGVWATAMEFDFAERSVTCFGYRWIAVTGSLCALEMPEKSPRLPVKRLRRPRSPLGRRRPKASEAPVAEPPARNGGRPGFPMEEMIEIARKRGAQREDEQRHWIGPVAGVRVRFPERQPPSHRTVVDTVADIYSEAQRVGARDSRQTRKTGFRGFSGDTDQPISVPGSAHVAPRLGTTARR